MDSGFIKFNNFFKLLGTESPQQNLKLNLYVSIKLEILATKKKSVPLYAAYLCEIYLPQLGKKTSGLHPTIQPSSRRMVLGWLYTFLIGLALTGTFFMLNQSKKYNYIPNSVGFNSIQILFLLHVDTEIFVAFPVDFFTIIIYIISRGITTTR